MISLFPGLKPDDIYFILATVIGLFIVAMLVKSTMHHNRFAGRVKILQERRQQLKSELMAPRKRAKKNTASVNVSFIRKIVNSLNLLQQTQVEKINKLLLNAGCRSKDAIFIYAFFQLVLPFVMLAVALLTVNIDWSDPFAVQWKPFSVILAAFIGVKMPSLFLINRRDKRYYAIQKGLSDTLDLLLICAESGLSLGAGLVRVSKELANTYPEMAEELELTSIELGFLPDRKKALTNFADRVDMNEVRGIVGVLIQTEKYGTPVAQALRVFAAEFRTQRMLRAEQKAARLPALLTLPMVVFILPPLFVVILTPAMLKMSDQLLGGAMR
jgi:tight adherence protein C